MIVPKKGDTVLVEFEVADVSGYHNTFRPLGFAPYIPFQKVVEIKPHEIQVGDYVTVNGDVLRDFRYRVLAIHGSDSSMMNGDTRRWVVMAHGDDIPTVSNINKVTLCVD